VGAICATTLAPHGIATWEGPGDRMFGFSAHETLAYLMAGILWLGLVAFAVLGGADFGAGVWDLLAITKGGMGEEERSALIRAIGPIWEANELWIIFVVTGSWMSFPPVFSAVTSALFIPLSLGLLGIVLRGAAFVYYTHFRSAASGGVWGRVFNIGSLAAPLMLGAVAAAIASGNVHVSTANPGYTNALMSWITPFSAACGALAIAICALLAACYMTVEGLNTKNQRLIETFRRRGLIVVVVVAALGLVAGALASYYAPYLFRGLLSRGLPLVILAVVDGVVLFGLLWLRRFRLARAAAGALVLFMLGGWALAQLPYLVIPALTVANAGADTSVLIAALITSVLGMVLVLPAIWYMLHLYKAPNRRQPTTTVDQFIRQLEADEARAAQQSEQALTQTLQEGPAEHLRQAAEQIRQGHIWRSAAEAANAATVARLRRRRRHAL